MITGLAMPVDIFVPFAQLREKANVQFTNPYFAFG